MQLVECLEFGFTTLTSLRTCLSLAWLISFKQLSNELPQELVTRQPYHHYGVQNLARFRVGSVLVGYLTSLFERAEHESSFNILVRFYSQHPCSLFLYTQIMRHCMRIWRLLQKKKKPFRNQNILFLSLIRRISRYGLMVFVVFCPFFCLYHLFLEKIKPCVTVFSFRQET